MIARISQTWIDIGQTAGIITGVLVCATAVGKALRWFFGWVRRGISAAVDLSDTAHLVRFHLGPNGTTTPMHQRMSRLEEAHGIPDSTIQPLEEPCSP